MLQSSETRTIPKKARKPQERTMYLRQAITAVTNEYEQMSIRQLFYQLVARRFIEKTEQAYKRVCDISGQMRISGELNYRKITDGHRTRRDVFQHGGIQDALEDAFELYRRNYWLDQEEHVEVWCEKDALTGIIQPVCDRYGVTYVATRGFPSITLIYESAQAIKNIGKPTTIFYFGDHDASGHSISDNLQPALRGHGADVTVYRVALDPEQVMGYNLPTRPGKRTDSRHAKFAARYGSASVELDALPPNVLTILVEDAIVSRIDRSSWHRAQRSEALEKETLASIAVVGWEPGVRYGLSKDEGANNE